MRDTYPGDPDSPSSWHRYIYAAADPVDNSDPSGLLVAPAPTPAVAPGKVASEYAALLTVAALPVGAIFADTLVPAAYDIQCVWQRAGAFGALAFTTSLGLYVPAQVAPTGCGVQTQPQPQPKPAPTLPTPVQGAEAARQTPCEFSCSPGPPIFRL
jgi:hypothetical protein